MKKRMRVLSLLLSLALLIPAVPVEPFTLAARAEEVAEATPQPSAGFDAPEMTDEAGVSIEAEVPATQTPASEKAEPADDAREAEDIESDETQDEAEVLPVEGEPLPEEAPEAETIDHAADASHSPAFAQGYVEVLEDDTPLYESEGERAELILRLGRGVVYALERSARPEEGEQARPDRLRVAVNLGKKGIVEGWLDARRVRPMEPEEEVPAFREFCAGLDGVRFYRDDIEIPLARTGYMLPETAAKQPEAPAGAKPSAAPEADTDMIPTESAHPIFMPELLPTVAPEGEAISDGEGAEAIDAAEGRNDAPESAASSEPTEMQPQIVQEELELYPGATAGLELTLPEGANALLRSSDNDVVTVLEDGKLMAVAPGEATITMTALDATDSCRVQVRALPQLGAKDEVLRLGVGERFDLLGEGFVTSTVNAAALRFRVQGDCVGVDADGVIEALTVGDAKVSVEVADSAVRAEIDVHVDTAATGVSLCDRLVLGEGASGNVGLSFSPSGSYYGYDLESSNDSVATVDASGKVKAISAGQTTITIRTRNGLSDTCEVMVYENVARIELAQSSITLIEGETGRSILPTAYDDEGSAILCEFDYEAADPSIIDVRDGELLPLRAGDTSVTVRARHDPDVAAVCEVHVLRAANRLTLRRESITLGVGDTFQLSDGPDGIIEIPAQEHVLSYIYDSTDITCATVGADGLITAKAPGSTAIHITPMGGETAELRVRVAPASTSIAFDRNALTLGACAAAALSVQFSSSDAYCGYSIESSDPSGALLSFEREGSSDTWNIRAGEVFEPSTVTLTVRSSLENYSDTCEVTILPGPKSADEIEISVNVARLGVGEEGGKVSASIAPGVRAAGGFSYDSSDPASLSVDPDGTLHALAASRTPVTITARASVPYAKDQYASASIRISVVDYPTEFSLNGSRVPLKLGTGDSYDLAGDPDGLIRIYPEGAQTSCTYVASAEEGMISDTAVISVSAEGRITAEAAGTAFMHITPHNGSDKETEVLKVEVSKAGDSVALSDSALRLGTGMTGVLEVMFPSETYARFSVENSDDEVLRLTTNGQTLTLKPLRAGTATIAVRSENGTCADSCLVTVLEAPTSADIALGLSAPDHISLEEVGKAIAVTLPEDKLGVISFESDDPGALKVDASSGVLTAQALPTNGEPVRVWVLVDGVRTCAHEIEILPLPKSLTLAAEAISVEEGRTYQISDALVRPDAGAGAVYSYEVFSDLQCTQASSEVATVSAAGLITAIQPGTAYIRISTQASASAVLSVNVVAGNEGFVLDPQAMTLGVGMSAKLTALRAPEGLRYEFDDTVARIDADGTVTAIAPGTTIVNAYSGDTLCGATASITVLPAPTAQQLRLSEDATLRVSASQKNANVRAVLPEGTMAELAYRIADEAPEGIELDEATGALTVDPNVPDTGSFTVEVYDINHSDVSRAFEIRLVPSAPISGLKVAALQLGVGEEFRLRDGRGGIIQLDAGDADATASYTFATYSDEDCEIESSDVATVDALSGLLTGRKAGTAYVRISCDRGGNDQVLRVNVSEVPSQLMLSPGALTLGVGMTGTLSVNYASGCSFTSSNESIVSVDGSGSVTALCEGSATITATGWDGKVDNCFVRVLPVPQAVRLLPEEGLIICVGQKGARVSAEPIDEGTMASFIYASESPEIVQVDAQTGELTPVAPGTATVTASVLGSELPVRAATSVTVKAAPQELLLRIESILLGVGDTYQLGEGDIELSDDVVTTYTYAASAKEKKNTETDVVTIGADGLITAKKVGTAYARITDQFGNTAAIKLSVRKAAGSIALSTSELTLGVGMKEVLSVGFPSKTYARYDVESSAPEIVSVASGANAQELILTAHGAGEASVTVRTTGGKTDSCRVYVLPGTQGIHVSFKPGVGSIAQMDDAGAYILGVGEAGSALTATPDEGTLASFSFTSDAPNVLSVNATSGELTPNAVGTARVTLRVLGEADVPSAVIPFRVVPKPASGTLSLKPAKLKLGVGDKYQIEEYDAQTNPDGIIHLEEGYSASYTYKSSNTKVASVSADGVISAKKAGTAKIRVTTQKAKVYKDITLTVTKYPKSLDIPSTLTLGAEMTVTFKPTFASGTFASVDYEVSPSDLLGVNVDPNSGACTLSAPARAVLNAPRQLTLTARLRKTGTTATCAVTLLPEPAAGGIEFDYDAMPNVETGDDGERYLRIGVRESGVNVVAKCSDPETLCDFEYSVDRGGLSVSATGALTASESSDEYYIVTAAAKSNPEATAELKVKVVPVPEGVDFSIKSLNLGVGDQFQLRDSRNGGIIVVSPQGASASFKFAASKYSNKTATTNVLSISSSGLITAKKAGTAYVKVSAQNAGVSKVLRVKVSKKAKSLSLTPEQQSIGELSAGSVALSFPSNSYSLVESCVSSDPELLRFEIDPLDPSNIAHFSVGRLPDGRGRDVTVSVTTQSGATATAIVSVLPHPTSVHFNQSQYELSSGMTLATQVTFPGGTDANDLRYESEDEEVAKIDENGVITGVNPSAETKTTTITVTANPDTEFEVSATASVTVLSAPASLEYEDLPAVLNLMRGDTVRIPEPVARTASGDVIPASYTFTSSDPGYVSISGNEMKALKTGKTVTIKAESHNRKTAALKVRVYDDAPTGLELYCEGAPINDAELKLYINDDHPMDSLKLTWRILGTDVNFGSASFDSSEPSVAVVDEHGVITAKSMGKTTITATTGKGGISAKCTVAVRELCSEPKLLTGDLVLSEGEIEQISVSFVPRNAGMRLRYESMNENIALVDSNGLITAVGGGETTVMIHGQHGWEREIRVRAYFNPDSVTLPVRKLYMNAPGLQPSGESGYDSVVLAPVLKRNGVTQAQDIDLWTEASSDKKSAVDVTLETPATATTPATYRLTAKARGRATITIRSKTAGIFAQCEVVVGTPEEAALANGFGWDVPEGKELVLMKGDSTPLDVALSSDVYRGSDFEIEWVPADALLLNEVDWTIQAQKEGSVTLSLKVGGQIRDTASIDIVKAEKVKLYYDAEGKKSVPKKAEMDVSSFKAGFAKHEIHVVPYSRMDSAVLLGSFFVDVGDPKLLTYDAQTLTISTTKQTGTATVTVTNFAGTITTEVSVLDAPVYRALLISEYNNSGNAHDLPFAQECINQVKAALKKSDIGGQKYKVTALKKNASQAEIKSAIADTFEGAKANDVSLIFIVAHGHMGSGSASNAYCFSLSVGGSDWSTKREETYVTDTELFNWIKASPAMQGKVMLVIDSCNSGAFITHQRSNLNKLNNLAVMTAQVGNKSASFYVGPYKGIETHEFFTRAFTTSVGYPIDVGANDAWTKAASGDTDGDGYITVKESFNCADEMTIAMIRKYCSKDYFNEASGKNGKYGFKSPGLTTHAKVKAWLSKNNGQDPQTYIPSAMKDVVFIGTPTK